MIWPDVTEGAHVGWHEHIDDRELVQALADATERTGQQAHIIDVNDAGNGHYGATLTYRDVCPTPGAGACVDPLWDDLLRADEARQRQEDPGALLRIRIPRPSPPEAAACVAP